MNTNLTRTALALVGTLVWLTTTAKAVDLRFSDIEDRLSRIESKLASQQGVQSVAYYADDADSSACGDSCCGDSCCASCGSNDCDSYYAEFQYLLLRPHVMEGAGAGGSKLSEEYESSIRIVFGYENNCGQGLRGRFWHYGNQVTDLNNVGGVRFEMNFFDAEVTQRFQGRRSDVVLAGGVRFGQMEILDNDNDLTNVDLIGLTAAADVRTLLCCECDREWNWVYGARLSILGGDWEGDAGNDFVDVNRDDNVFVTELYGGVEYGCCYCGYDLYTRLTFEMQNWHSDNVAQNSGTDTIGFVGPAWHIGVGF